MGDGSAEGQALRRWGSRRIRPHELASTRRARHGLERGYRHDRTTDRPSCPARSARTRLAQITRRPQCGYRFSMSEAAYRLGAGTPKWLVRLGGLRSPACPVCSFLPTGSCSRRSGHGLWQHLRPQHSPLHPLTSLAARATLRLASPLLAVLAAIPTGAFISRRGVRQRDQERSRPPGA